MVLYAVCTEHVELVIVCFVLMIRRPPRSTQSRSSAASDVYKRQVDVGVPLLSMHSARELAHVDDLHGLARISASFLSCLLYTSPSPRDRTRSRMPSSA